MGAWVGCTGLHDISIGTDARDGGFDVSIISPVVERPAGLPLICRGAFDFSELQDD
jgi:hypothetical protein